MQRREFSRTLALSACATTTLPWLGLGTAQAQTPNLQEGKDYRRLNQPVATETTAGQVEVLEFFAYTCGHCHKFEPLLKDWVKTLPANVKFRRVPVLFDSSFEPFQRMYYTLEALGQLDTLHEKFFSALHDQRQPLRTPEAMANWAAQQGLDKTQFTQTFNSFGVTGKIKRAAQLQNAYEIEGTPALGIAGRYTVTGAGARNLAVAQVLIAQQRKG